MEYLEYGKFRFKPDVRTVSDMLEVLRPGGEVEGPPTRPLYYMYRDLSLSRADSLRIKEARLRFDITVIPPGALGSEWVKTKGHYHPVVPGYELTYAEVYEVLSGEAIYLLQREEGGLVKEFRSIRASEGDKVIIPPGFGHVTVNPSNRVLKICNWVCRDFVSKYGSYVSKKGAAYYALTTGELMPNESYEGVPGVLDATPMPLPEYGLVRAKEMYGLVKDISKLEFLTRPWEHIELWERLQHQG